MMIMVMLAMGVMLDDCHGGGDDSLHFPAQTVHPSRIVVVE